MSSFFFPRITKINTGKKFSRNYERENYLLWIKFQACFTEEPSLSNVRDGDGMSHPWKFKMSQRMQPCQTKCCMICMLDINLGYNKLKAPFYNNFSLVKEKLNMYATENWDVHGIREQFVTLSCVFFKRKLSCISFHLKC